MLKTVLGFVREILEVGWSVLWHSKRNRLAQGLTKRHKSRIDAALGFVILPCCQIPCHTEKVIEGILIALPFEASPSTVPQELTLRV